VSRPINISHGRAAIPLPPIPRWWKEVFYRVLYGVNPLFFLIRIGIGEGVFYAGVLIPLQLFIVIKWIEGE
jgi:hypothetical protein